MDYDADYFERGIETGKSLYSNYRWIPELTIPLAYEFIKILNLQEQSKVLDFGCAKGYLVKAFRLLHIDAYGCDISEYALEQADSDIKPYLYTDIPSVTFDAVIAKDVFEHLDERSLDRVLYTLSNRCKSLFVIVPLGDGIKYHVPSYELDTTHIIRQRLEWWQEKIGKHFSNVEARYEWGHIKTNWVSHEKFGNGFILATR